MALREEGRRVDAVRRTASAGDRWGGRPAPAALSRKRAKGRRLSSRRNPLRRAEPQLPRARQPERRVGRGDHDAAVVEVLAHDRGEGACAAASSAVVGSSSSQSGRRATSSRASATRRFCPADSARAGKSITWARPTRASAERHASRARIAAERARPEGEVLAGGQRPLQRVGVAEVMRLLADRALGVAALEGEAAGLERQESRRARAKGSTCRPRSAR